MLHVWLRDAAYDCTQVVRAGIDATDFLSPAAGGRARLSSRNIENWSQFFCSEFCGAALKVAGVPQFAGLNTSELTPADLDSPDMIGNVFFPGEQLLAWAPHDRSGGAP